MWEIKKKRININTLNFKAYFFTNRKDSDGFICQFHCKECFCSCKKRTNGLSANRQDRYDGLVALRISVWIWMALSKALSIACQACVCLQHWNAVYVTCLKRVYSLYLVLLFDIWNGEREWTWDQERSAVGEHKGLLYVPMREMSLMVLWSDQRDWRGRIIRHLSKAAFVSLWCKQIKQKTEAWGIKPFVFAGLNTKNCNALNETTNVAMVHSLFVCMWLTFLRHLRMSSVGKTWYSDEHRLPLKLLHNGL